MSNRGFIQSRLEKIRGHCWHALERNEFRTLARNVPDFFKETLAHARGSERRYRAATVTERSAGSETLHECYFAFAALVKTSSVVLPSCVKVPLISEPCAFI